MKTNIKNLTKTITSMVLLLSFFTNTVQAVEPTKKAVRFIYFVEKDQTYSKKDFDAIKKQAFVFQKYWNEQFGGTFYLTKHVVDVVMGDHDADWYVEDSRWARYSNLEKEVSRKIEGSHSLRTITYPKAVRNHHVGAGWNGARMDGDDITCIINGDDKSVPGHSTNGEAQCLGHLAHEFGHTYGLGHVGESKDCMRYGLYNTDKVCDFGEENRITVLEKSANKDWLAASPLETVDGYKSYPYNPHTVVEMENPNYSTLSDTTEIFTWVKYGTDIEKYRVLVGSKKGTSNYYKSPILASDATMITVTNLPNDGSSVHVRIKYKIESKWYRQDYQYNAVNNTNPTIIFPIAGERFISDTETFTWIDNGVAVSKYKLFVGSTKGGSDYYKSAKLSADTESLTVNGLPIDGSKVYVKFLYIDENNVRTIRHFIYRALEE